MAELKGEITLYMTNDMGRNGYYDQKPIAELMGEMAGTVDPECVLAVGDIHHSMAWLPPRILCGLPITNMFILIPT